MPPSHKARPRLSWGVGASECATDVIPSTRSINLLRTLILHIEALDIITKDLDVVSPEDTIFASYNSQLYIL
jgi:hypothetical protein